MARSTTNEQVARYFDKTARKYDRQMAFFERFLLGRARQWAVAQAEGEVVELAVGTGLNLPLYPDAVSHVTGVELSEQMVALARQRVSEHQLGDRVEMRQGDVQALDLPEASADTVVSTYTYCTIPDPLVASREAWRVLRPGGKFVLAEHGPSTHAVARGIMRAVNPLSIRFNADSLMRDPVPFVEQAGFAIDSVEREGRAGVVFRVLAHKPSADD